MSNGELPVPSPEETDLAARELAAVEQGASLDGLVVAAENGVPPEFVVLAARIRQSRESDQDFPHVHIRPGTLARILRERRETRESDEDPQEL